MKVFPTCHFNFEGRDVDIERRVLSGGTALSGDEDTIAVDGGGRLYAVFSNAYLDDPELALAWKAINAGYGEGRPIAVQIGDAREQMMGDIALPPRVLPLWDDDDFASIESHATVAAAAALRATEISVDVTDLPRPVRAGQWFSVDHTVHRHRAYRIFEIVSDDGDTAVLAIRPPLREALGGGEAVNFTDPKCMMRIDGGAPSPSSLGYSEGSIRFVEDFSTAVYA